MSLGDLGRLRLRLQSDLTYYICTKPEDMPASNYILFSTYDLCRAHKALLCYQASRRTYGRMRWIWVKHARKLSPPKMYRLKHYEPVLTVKWY
jgi:hypothetical protein